MDKPKLNILSIEKARNELLSFIENTGSKRLKAKRICVFFAILIEHKSFSLIESYVLEFIPKYLDCMKDFSPFGASPEFTHNIIQLNNKLIETNATAEYKARLTQLNYEIQTKLHSLNKILAGEQSEFQYDRKAFFPLIEAEQDKSIDQTVGAIDSITIKVSKGKQKDKFIVVPSENESDKQLEEQINVSWIKAKEFCKKHIRKLSQYHEVIISFDGNLGVYRGESLGAALTIAMIEELLRYYNSQTVLLPGGNVAFTGGISESGKVNKVSKEIVGKKVEIAFYSNCQTLAVPKEDETFALYKLDELYKLYPKRNLRLVGVSDLDEILLRRDLVEIKKQKLVVRTAKFVKKNWVSAVVAVLLAILFGYLFVVDWDDNPANIYADGNSVFIKNRNGKVLWTQKFSLPKEALEMTSVLDNFVLIDDVNNDGKNEVLFTHVNPGNEYKGVENWSIFCLDYEKNFKWKFTLKDTVISKREIIPPPYRIEIIDTLNEHGRKRLIVFANSALSFASAIFKIDLQTGQKVGGIFWSSGHISNAMLRDVNGDGVKEVVQWGLDNGYEDVILCCINVDSLIGYRPTMVEYKVINKPQANLLGYIRFPKNDYEQLTLRRVSLLYRGCFNQTNDENNIVFSVNIYKDLIRREEHTTGVFYQVSNNLKDIDVFIHDEFRILRDTLVARGTLKQPYTDTKEYIDILKSKILYYKEGKWVKREELD